MEVSPVDYGRPHPRRIVIRDGIRPGRTDDGADRRRVRTAADRCGERVPRGVASSVDRQPRGSIEQSEPRDERVPRGRWQGCAERTARPSNAERRASHARVTTSAVPTLAVRRTQQPTSGVDFGPMSSGSAVRAVPRGYHSTGRLVLRRWFPALGRTSSRWRRRHGCNATR